MESKSLSKAAVRQKSCGGRQRQRPVRLNSIAVSIMPETGQDHPEARPQTPNGCTMISQKARYALRALTALAQAESGSSMMISEIAVQQCIPKKFLEQILLDLKRAGLVASRRGKQGGYLLLKPANAITYGEVLRLIDGPIAPLPCLSVTAYRKCEDCDGEQGCEIRHVFARVADATRDVLFSTTIADAISSTNSEHLLRA